MRPIKPTNILKRDSNVVLYIFDVPACEGFSIDPMVKDLVLCAIGRELNIVDICVNTLKDIEDGNFPKSWSNINFDAVLMTDPQGTIDLDKLKVYLFDRNAKLVLLGPEE